MWLAPPSLEGSRENDIRIPVMPASPTNRAHKDQSHAAPTPTEMRVSIVAAPCRRLVQAARWNGNAPQTTTGDARVRESHCQLSNCHAGTIDSSSTGRLNPAVTASLRRRADASSSGCAEVGPAATSVCPGAVGRVAV